MYAVMNKTIKFRAAYSTLIIFETMFGIFFVGYLILQLWKGVGWDVVILLGAVCVTIYVWWSRYAVELDRDKLYYRCLLLGSRIVALSDISHVVKKTLLKSSGLRPPFRLEVYYMDAGKEKEFDINLRVFSLDNVRILEKGLDVRSTTGSSPHTSV